MKCKRCGAQYSAKELECPYCGEPNSLGMHWKNTEEKAKNETENISYICDLRTRFECKRPSEHKTLIRFL